MALLSSSIFAQYKVSLEKAIEFEKNGKFYEAIQMYNAANVSWDKPANNDIDKRINFCTERLNQTLKQAKIDEQAAKDLSKKNAENVEKIQQNIAEILKGQGDKACEDFNWGDALLYYQQAYKKYPQNNKIAINIKKALENITPEVTVLSHPQLVNDIIFNPSGKYLITASGKTIQVFNLETYENEYVLRGFSQNVTALAFSSDPNILMSYSNDGSIRFWNLKDGSEIGKWRHHFYGKNVLNKIAFDIEQKFYIMALDNSLFVYSLDDNHQLAVIMGHKNNITSFSYSPDKHLLISSSSYEKEGSIRMNDLTDINKEEVRFIRSLASSVRDVEIQSGGNYIVYTSTIGLGSVGVYDVDNDVTTNVISEQGIVGKIALNSSNNTLAYLYNIDNESFPIYLYDLNNLSAQKKKAKINDHETYSVIMAAFSPDGKYLASTDKRGYVRLWNLKPELKNNFEQDLPDACKLGLPFRLDDNGNFKENDIDSLLNERRRSNVNWIPKGIKNQKGTFIGDDSPLMKHIRYGRWEAAKNLIAENNGLNYRNEQGYTPLMYAIIQNKPDLINLLKKNQIEDDILFTLAIGDTKYIDRYWTYSRNYDYANSYGETAIHIAAANDNYEAVKFLCINANLNSRTLSNETPLMVALKNRNERIADLLLAVHPELNVKESESGWNELIAASYRGYTKIVEKLLEKKVNLNEQDNDGGTAMWNAASNGYTEIVKLIVKAGADKEIRDKKNKVTSLILTAYNGDIEGCKTLLEAGASVNGEDHFKRTALYYAILNNYYDVVKLLLSNKANPYAKDIYDKPLTQYVVESKNDSIIKIFEKYKNSFTTPFRFEKFVELKGEAINYSSYLKDNCTMTISKIDSTLYECTVNYGELILVGEYVGRGKESSATGGSRVFMFEGYVYTGKKGQKTTYLPGSNSKCNVQIALLPNGDVVGVYHLGHIGENTLEQYGTYNLKLIESK